MANRHKYQVDSFRYGFVHFRSSESCENALRAESITDDRFRRIRILKSTSQKGRSSSIKINGIDMDCNEHSLKTLFEVFGPIDDVFIPKSSKEAYNTYLR